MDPISLIVAALTAGATTGVKDTASSAIKDAYNSLKSLIRHKCSDQSRAVTTLGDFEDDPDTYEKPLRKILNANHLNQDEAIIAAAGQLMKLIQPQQASMGKYNIQNMGTSQGQIIGEHANVTQHFGDYPKE